MQGSQFVDDLSMIYVAIAGEDVPIPTFNTIGVSKGKPWYNIMKNHPISLFLIIALASCTYNNVELQKTGINSENGINQPEKWQLVEIYGSIANDPPLTGSNMGMQEWYVFYPDHSFTKTQVRDNVTTTASGSYAVVTSSDGQYLELTYPSDNKLIGNCTAEPKELLSIKSDRLANTWSMCDGPGLIYKKVKNNVVLEKSGG